MKKIFLKILILNLFLVLTGCSQNPVDSNNEKTVNTVVKNKNNFKMELPIEDSNIYYNSEFSDAYVDFDEMEVGLQKISSEYVDSSKYFLKSGGILNSEDLQKLINRESLNNPYGLNPELSTKAQDSPEYVNAIVEQDFYIKDTKEQEQIDYIALGFGIDTSYNYSQDGVKEINDDEIIEYITNYISQKIITYIRNVKNQEVNIILGFYKESSKNDLPGNYLTYGLVQKDSNQIKDIKVINEQYVVLPDDKDNSINDAITTLDEKIRYFFTTYTGIISYGKYSNDDIVEVSSNIIISEYSQIQVQALIEYIEENIPKNLKNLDKYRLKIKLPSDEIVAILEYSNEKLNVKYLK